MIKLKSRRYFLIALFLLFFAPLVVVVLKTEDVFSLMVFEFVFLSVYLIVAVCFIVKEQNHIVRIFTIITIVLSLFLYISIRYEIKKLNDKYRFSKIENILNEIVELMDNNKNIVEIKALRNSEYNTLNHKMLSENPELLDSLGIDSNVYIDIRDKMRKIEIMEVQKIEDVIIIRRVISMWGDDGWVFFRDLSLKKRELFLKRFKSNHSVTDNWYYWYAD